MTRSAKVIILSSGQALTALVGLLNAAILARLFSQVDYAAYRQCLLSYTFAAPFVTLGLNQALFHFLPKEKERPRGLLTENLLLLSVGGLALSLFLLAGGNELLARRFNNPDLSRLLILMAPYPLLMLPAASLGACLLARGRPAEVAQYNVSTRLLMLAAVVVPSLIWPRPMTAVLGTVLGAAVSLAVGLFLMYRACGEGPGRPTWSGAKRQLAFSVPLGMSTIIATTNKSLDQVFVAALCSPAAFAVFVNGAMEIPLIGIVTGSVTSVLAVEYSKLYAEGNTAEIVRLIHRAMIKCALLLIPSMAFLLCMAPEVMRLLYGPQYEGSAAPFRVYLLLLPLRVLTFSAIFLAAGKSGYILLQAVIPLVSKLCFTWLAVRAWGSIGAAVSTVLIAYCITLPYSSKQLSGLVQRPIRALFPWKDLLRVMVACFVPAAAVLFLKDLSSLPDSLAVGMMFGVYALLAMAMLAWLKLVDPRKLVAEIQKRVVDRFALVSGQRRGKTSI